jgi:hypothetical protein
MLMKFIISEHDDDDACEDYCATSVTGQWTWVIKPQQKAHSIIFLYLNWNWNDTKNENFKSQSVHLCIV